MKKLLILLTLWTTLANANDSFYTQTKDEKVIEDDNAICALLKSPNDYNVTVCDCGGGFMMQLVINDYTLQTAKLPKVIEWRINNKKKIIGAIVRTYEPVWNEKKEDFEEGKYSSVLSVLSFKSEIKFLGKTSSNAEARLLLDKEKR